MCVYKRLPQFLFVSTPIHPQQDLHSASLEMLAVSCVNFAAIGFYTFGVKHNVIAWLIFVLILCLIITRELYVWLRDSYELRQHQLELNEQMFDIQVIDRARMVCFIAFYLQSVVFLCFVVMIPVPR